MIVTNLNWIFLIACMSAMRTHAAFEFVPILDKHASKEIKNLQENQKPHFNKNKANNSENPSDIVKFK